MLKKKLKQDNSRESDGDESVLSTRCSEESCLRKWHLEQCSWVSVPEEGASHVCIWGKSVPRRGRGCSRNSKIISLQMEQSKQWWVVGDEVQKKAGGSSYGTLKTGVRAMYFKCQWGAIRGFENSCMTWLNFLKLVLTTAWIGGRVA